MNKLDKQFAEMMKDVRIESPLSDFSLKVMSRIQAEAAVTRRPLLLDYKPVISKRTWIILIVLFAALMIYITVAGTEPVSANDQGTWSAVSGSMSKFNTSLLEKGSGLFASIPMVAYLILLASLSLWTLDSFLTRVKHNSSKIH